MVKTRRITIDDKTARKALFLKIRWIRMLWHFNPAPRHAVLTAAMAACARDNNLKPALRSLIVTEVTHSLVTSFIAQATTTTVKES